ncbi:hypothetical protein [Methylotetracoccus oryzae]|uniref:hypothetical protein n=1 Tax=Methylotetracoccus oryzae TaxID=1919059 RepID=UPI00111A6572|nr:hypothetical protein [Methylotetracoccus oryzae]
MVTQTSQEIGSVVAHRCPLHSLLACLTVLGMYGQAEAISLQTQGRVSYVSGGVGQDEVCQIKGMKAAFNLHLLFAETPASQFLADIPVRIISQDGATVLDTRSEGPYLYAHLAPGRYKIVAENGDRIQTRQVRILSQMRPTAVSFLWKSTEPRSSRIRVDSLPHC